MTAMARAPHDSITLPGVLASCAAAAQFVDLAYREHASSTYASAMRTTRDPDAAADVTQEAFMRLLTEARKGRRPDNTAAWLCRAATNVAISRARRTVVARRLAPRLLDRSTPDQPETLVLEYERGSELARVLGGLRPLERRALILAAQGMPGSEIAQNLGRSHGATRAMMCRARGRLRVSLVQGSAA